MSLLVFPSMKVSEATIQDYANHRGKMVERQMMDRGIKDLRVLETMSRIPRHLFVPDALQHKAYGDHPLPIGENQTISQPYTVGIMTAALNLGTNDRVLEIGTGSGYQTAVLAELAANVFTIERIKQIGQEAKKRLEGLNYLNIIYKTFDGTYGWPDHAPFDAIMVTAGVKEIPKPLVLQLKDRGRIVIPIGNEGNQNLVLATKTNGNIRTKIIANCKFVPLIGKFGWAEKPSTYTPVE